MIRQTKVFLFILVLLVISSSVTAGPIEIYFGPNGGFNIQNSSRTFTFSSGKVYKATLANSFIYELDQTEVGSTIKVAMYSMSDFRTLDAMISAARDKQIHFKLILDGAAAWSKSSREKIVERVKIAADKAKAENIPFDFNIAIVTAKAMERNGRTATLDDGRVIFGTMHEKFGVFYKPGNPVPYTSFCGSSNLSTTSDEIYGENRVFLHDRPGVARQFQEEFARLWNEYCEIVLGEYVPEKFIPVNAEAGDVKVIFNSEPVDELNLTRIDNELLNLLRKINNEGRLDLSMFSLTRPELAQAIVRAAERCPEAPFRILLDHAQLDDSDPKASKLAPWIEQRVAELGLKNVQIRYRFRRNAYGYDERNKRVDLISFMSLFLHHKTVIVNGTEMGLGSYNWSGAAEYLNYENVMLFNGLYNGHQKVIDAFMREFDTVWNSPTPYHMVSHPRMGEPQTVTGVEGRKLHKELIKLLSDKANLKVKTLLDREAFKTFDTLKTETGFSTRKLKRVIKSLTRAGLICKWTREGLEGYSQAD